MKRLMHGLIFLSALSLTTSCATFKKQQEPPTEVALCSAAALVDPVVYRLEIPQSKSDKEFKLWVADVLEKYPQLFKSYKDLRECWFLYHPLTEENK